MDLPTGSGNDAGLQPPAETETPSRSADSARARLAALLLSLLIAAFLAELALRTFCRTALAPDLAASNLAYRYDPELGWFPKPFSQMQVRASRTFTVIHNSRGFRGPEPSPTGKPGIMFLGDSLLWGFDVEASERFTERIQATHPQWDIENLGVSGYGTDQEYLLLKKEFDAYRPKVVFLVICGDNDNDDNASNCRDGYYKPYFTVEAGRLKLNGVPVPRSEKVFFAEHKVLCRSFLLRLLARAYHKIIDPPVSRNPDPPTGILFLEMRNYVVGKGAFFGVGLQHSNAELQKFLDEFKIPYVDLTTSNPGHCYPAFGNHWTPEGHAFVADKISRFLEKR